MSIKDGIQARFDAMSGDLHSVDVPEWGGKVFYTDFIPLGDALKILKYAAPDGSFDLQGLVEGLIITARNDDRTRMFTNADRDLLMTKTESHVILRIVQEMQLVERLMGAVEKKT